MDPMGRMYYAPRTTPGVRVTVDGNGNIHLSVYSHSQVPSVYNDIIDEHTTAHRINHSLRDAQHELMVHTQNTLTYLFTQKGGSQ